jgi:hypothetical protein
MDLLSDILSHIQLSGTLYFRTSFTSPWSIRVPSYEYVARFHFVHKGRCLVRIEVDQPPLLMEKGDLVIITRGASTMKLNLYAGILHLQKMRKTF